MFTVILNNRTFFPFIGKKFLICGDFKKKNSLTLLTFFSSSLWVYISQFRILNLHLAIPGVPIYISQFWISLRILFFCFWKIGNRLFISHFSFLFCSFHSYIPQFWLFVPPQKNIIISCHLQRNSESCIKPIAWTLWCLNINRHFFFFF